MRGLLALAFSQLGQGQLAAATDTYRQTRRDGRASAPRSRPPASATSPLYEGRFSDAVRHPRAGRDGRICAGKATRTRPRAKFDLASPTRSLSRGQVGPARRRGRDRALTNSKSVDDPVPGRAGASSRPASREEGPAARRRPGGSSWQPEPQAYGEDPRWRDCPEGRRLRAAAIKALTDANGMLDTWFGHFDLGRAYLEEGAFLQADAEFDRCIKRRGEVLSLFDEDVDVRSLPSRLLLSGTSPPGVKYRGVRGRVPHVPGHPRHVGRRSPGARHPQTHRELTANRASTASLRTPSSGDVA